MGISFRLTEDEADEEASPIFELIKVLPPKCITGKEESYDDLLDCEEDDLPLPRLFYPPRPRICDHGGSSPPAILQS